ncbi:SDR family oxidoreductase [Schlegelella sp. S2-27]|uniref:SDR family oxidoreductase n=1 Tax=Caldimonas mangrovi TaxID=2944811 RepID=A0ABT0YRS3_9BURK|nr:SDR family oxidoreductase [Caldimonas mangrovi]MCM5681430.1 SDR family oxidoreductase [Caldimonas mangrovi]
MTNLTHKTALVTGGSRGIGAAIACRLAADGADVAFTYRSARADAERVSAQIEAHGRRALAIAADSADRGALEAAVAQTAAAFGRIDVLVHNAGIFLTGEIGAVDLADLDQLLAVHVAAPVVATRAALQHMPAGGRVISIGSCLAERVPGAGMSLYAMSKSALTGFTKGIARDLGPRGITANVVHPGPVDTDMNPADSEHADAQRGLLALGRFGQAEEVAAMVAFLAGDGGRFVTGASITVDGGHNA